MGNTSGRMQRSAASVVPLLGPAGAKPSAQATAILDAKHSFKWKLRLIYVWSCSPPITFPPRLENITIKRLHCLLSNWDKNLRGKDFGSALPRFVHRSGGHHLLKITSNVMQPRILIGQIYDLCQMPRHQILAL